MPVTEDQAKEILDRIKSGERYPVICLSMKISDQDSYDWARTNSNKMIEAAVNSNKKKAS